MAVNDTSGGSGRRLSSKLLRAPLSVAYRLLYRGVRNGYGIEVPYSARIGRRVTIEHQSDIVIHGNGMPGIQWRNTKSAKGACGECQCCGRKNLRFA